MRCAASACCRSRERLSNAIWVVLTGGAVITVAFTYLFGVPNARSQTVMTAALTAVIAGSLYLIFDLSTPYSGPLDVEPARYQGEPRVVLLHGSTVTRAWGRPEVTCATAPTGSLPTWLATAAGYRAQTVKGA